MGTTNEETVARSEKAETNSDDISGGNRVTGSTSSIIGNQQERDIRACSSEPNIFSPGTTVTGGMLDHLIDDTLDQVAAKEDEAKRVAVELKRLKARLQELKALREELSKQSEQNE
jgi:chromosome segregation ATPase